MEEILSLAATLSASLEGGSPYPSIDPEKPFLGYCYTVEEVEEGGEELYGIPALMADGFRVMGRSVSREGIYHPQYGFVFLYKSESTAFGAGSC